MYNHLGDLRLPHYLQIEIVRSEADVRVLVHSKIHVTKTKEMPHSYSTEFSDADILNDPDFIKAVCNMYTLKKVTYLE